MIIPPSLFFFFFFNDTATTEIYTLSLHDALPISGEARAGDGALEGAELRVPAGEHQLLQERPDGVQPDRKSTRLNSSHGYISYAVFCLKKKKKKKIRQSKKIKTWKSAGTDSRNST